VNGKLKWNKVSKDNKEDNRDNKEDNRDNRIDKDNRADKVSMEVLTRMGQAKWVKKVGKVLMSRESNRDNRDNKVKKDNQVRKVNKASLVRKAKQVVRMAISKVRANS
jgi:hypothetical protein